MIAGVDPILKPQPGTEKRKLELRMPQLSWESSRRPRWLSHAVAAALSTASLSSSADGAEPTVADPQREPPLDLRLSAGIGAGSLDNVNTLALRAGFAADVWLTPALALGAEVGVLAQTSILDSSGEAWTFMPEVAYRSFLSPKSYLLVVGSFGYVQNEIRLVRPCEDECSLFNFGDTEYVMSHSLGSSAQFGYVADPGPVFWGLALRGDFVGYPVSNGAPMHGAVTLNGLFGF